MANFNPADYETVDSRIKRFYQDHVGGRITTELVAAEGDPGRTRWIVKASVWRDRIDGEPDGTGYAFELDGSGMANKTSALENGETSAIGRALANIGYSGDKRASREEMQKAQAGPPKPPTPPQNVVNQHLAALSAAETIDALQAAWTAAGQASVSGHPDVIDAKDKRKAALS